MDSDRDRPKSDKADVCRRGVRRDRSGFMLVVVGGFDDHEQRSLARK